MTRVFGDLVPAAQPDYNRLVVGADCVKIESFEPLGDVVVLTSSGLETLHYAAVAQCRCRTGAVEYLFGEKQGSLFGAPVAVASLAAA